MVERAEVQAQTLKSPARKISSGGKGYRTGYDQRRNDEQWNVGAGETQVRLLPGSR